MDDDIHIKTDATINLPPEVDTQEKAEAYIKDLLLKALKQKGGPNNDQEK